MYNVIKNYLTNGSYALKDAQERIDYAVMGGHITPTQASELLAIANDKAKMVGGLEGEVSALRERLSVIQVALAGQDGRIGAVMEAVKQTAELALTPAKRVAIAKLLAGAAGEQAEPGEEE